MAYTTTDSGLGYRILRKSDGNKPKATDKVTVHYKGWLEDETEFDSSYKRGQPATFPLNAVIAGWTEGLQLIGEGGMIELKIPSELGYGERGAGGLIPPNATLFFQVELEKIEDAIKRKRYPVCLDGARRCPPEDVGGVWAYMDFLEAIRDRSTQNGWSDIFTMSSDWLNAV